MAGLSGRVTPMRPISADFTMPDRVAAIGRSSAWNFRPDVLFVHSPVAHYETMKVRPHSVSVSIVANRLRLD
jgi:hypothetical protein